MVFWGWWDGWRAVASQVQAFGGAAGVWHCDTPAAKPEARLRDTDSKQRNHGQLNSSCSLYGSSCAIAKPTGGYRRSIAAPETTQNSRASESSCSSPYSGDEYRHANR